MTRRRNPSPIELQTAQADPRLQAAHAARRITNLNWRDQAACSGKDIDAFFPEPSGPTAYPLQICKLCDVRDTCLADALNVQEREGIRGATTPRERAAMLIVWNHLEPEEEPAEQAPAVPSDWVHVPRCAKGHPQTPEVAGADKNGRPYCKTCMRQNGAKGGYALIKTKQRKKAAEAVDAPERVPA